MFNCAVWWRVSLQTWLKCVTVAEQWTMLIQIWMNTQLLSLKTATARVVETWAQCTVTENWHCKGGWNVSATHCRSGWRLPLQGWLKYEHNALLPKTVAAKEVGMLAQCTVTMDYHRKRGWNMSAMHSRCYWWLPRQGWLRCECNVL